MGKAVAAAITGLPSDRLVEKLGKGGPRLSSYDNVVPPRGRRGGLPVVEAGIVQGGCGVSGAPTAEEDEDCARAGIAALSTAPQQNRHFHPILAGLRLSNVPVINTQPQTAF
jgi:uncharacterized protein GlcG (DUF336 family)